MNVLFIRDTIYRMKQDYGQRMDLYVPSKSIVDFSSGQQNVIKKKYCLPKAVLFSDVLTARLVKDIAALTAGRNFAYGGTFDEGKKMIIVSADDLPRGVQLDSSCYIIYDHVNYGVDKIDILEHRCGYVITMSRVNTTEPGEIMCLHANSTIQWTGVVAHD